MNLNELATKLEGLSNRIPVATNELAKEVATVVHTDLVNVTPVDIGRAMSNWQVTTDGPAITSIPAYVPSPEGKMVNGKWTHTVPPQETFQANVGPALDEAKIIIEAKQPGQDLFITNNLVYIQPLDEGHSEQTPAGFVDRAMILAKDFIDRSKLTL